MPGTVYSLRRRLLVLRRNKQKTLRFKPLTKLSK
jgi:hypothetical protein